MNSKKGQFTMFVIFAVIIVVIVLFFIFLRSRSYEDVEDPMDPKLLIAKELIEYCVEDAAKDAIYSEGLDSQYFQFAINDFLDGDLYYWEGYGSPVSTGDIASYVDDQVVDCQSEGSDVGVKVTSVRSPKTTVSVADSKLVFLIDYPLTLSSGGSAVLIDEMNVEIEVPIYHLGDGEIETATSIDDMKRISESNNFQSKTATYSSGDYRFLVVSDDRPSSPFVYLFISN